MKRNSGLLHHSRNERNRKAIEAALENLSNSHQLPRRSGRSSYRALMNWEQNVAYKKRSRVHVIDDVKYTVWSAPNFVADIKAANTRLRDQRATLQIAPGDHHSPFLDKPPAESESND